MAGKAFETLASKITSHDRRFIRKALDISEQVHEILDMKSMSQKAFAQLLGKKESEVSKWLSGIHNLTIDSITKMEDVLGCDIIATPKRSCKEYPSYENYKKIIFQSQKKAAGKAAFLVNSLFTIRIPSFI